MGNKIIRFLLILIIPICLNGQYKNVNITFDDRLLRSDEKQEIFSLKQNINQFLTATTWDEAYSDLGINLHIQIIFENSQTKGNVKIYNCQSLFSNGGDLRYFDKQVQFYYNSGTSLYFDPVLFEPLPGFLAYYAYIILAGEIDTYEYNGGNNAYETAREIAQRGTASDYKKGWGNRISIIDDINRVLVNDNSDIKSTVQGIELIKNKFVATLDDLGINSYDSIEKVFDPDYHEAIMIKKTKGKSNVVIEEYEKGYTYHDKVIRHAKVVVSE